MSEIVNLKIDDIQISVAAGTTILHAAEEIGIHIPRICFHENCTANALCRICVVEVKGARTLIPSCVAEVQENMEVHTNTERVRSSRKTILEMMAASLDLSQAPEIQEYMREYQADSQRFPHAATRLSAIIDDNPMFIRDYSKCILCWRCVQVCAEDAQYTFAINFRNRGFNTQISTFYENPLPETTCVFCGQCLGVCPTNALKTKKEYLIEEGVDQAEIMELTRTLRQKKTRQSSKAGNIPGSGEE